MAEKLNEMDAEITRLRKMNAELLAELKEAKRYLEVNHWTDRKIYKLICAAIARCEAASAEDNLSDVKQV